ncbi:hypothetical protein CCUG60884_04006 [Mycobacteroides salmoniphilum]|uniref:Uncharacterized protein n=1 Tax=Mycobacteroides salmoniphilum TaxID=404941 RepID=A0A4V3I0J5_9MYCO|nr:hypothetical protein CCUG60884_04006 [Mycobacteroides salmoniphilum]
MVTIFIIDQYGRHSTDWRADVATARPYRGDQLQRVRAEGSHAQGACLPGPPHSTGPTPLPTAMNVDHIVPKTDRFTG